MLELTRNINQSLMIGDDIKLTILGNNKGKQVRVGIEAPQDVPVHREEVYKRIQDENEVWKNHKT